MKNILLIATGGTIASKPTKYGLTPSITSEQILEQAPNISSLCNVSAIQLMNIDSTNMSPYNWLEIVKCIKENYNKYDGFVIAHGTDTLAYTASALSYLIQNPKKPIVLTGSQKSIYLQETDARRNLYDSFLFACDDHAHGVNVVFNSKIITGTRARKIKTHSYDAFDSIDFPYVGIIFNDRIIYYINEKIQGDVIFYDDLNVNVNILKLVPGMDAKILEYLGSVSDVIIIEGFGVGGLPNYDNESKMLKVATNLRKNGKIMVLSTSVPHEGSNTSVYEVGGKVKNSLNILENYNMTLESTVCKMMWITSITKDINKIEKMFYTAISHDILI